jgi:hypothetical protein
MLQHFGERVAMNSPIQGTAADIIKIAMIHVSEKLKESGLDARLILQVHDELLIEARREQADEVLDLLQYEMEHGNYLDIECYPYKNTKYYIIEAWPTGGGVGEEEHTFSIRWEKDGYVYDLYLNRAVTSHEAAKEVVHGIKY